MGVCGGVGVGVGEGLGKGWGGGLRRGWGGGWGGVGRGWLSSILQKTPIDKPRQRQTSDDPQGVEQHRTVIARGMRLLLKLYTVQAKVGQERRFSR